MVADHRYAPQVLTTGAHHTFIGVGGVVWIGAFYNEASKSIHVKLRIDILSSINMNTIKCVSLIFISV